MMDRFGIASKTLVICGDPIICRALVLLLRGPDYDARFLPVSSLGDSGSLEDIQLLLLALERSAKHREAFFSSLEVALGATEIPVLELVAVSDWRRGGRRALGCSDYEVPWPCSTDTLKRHIEVALSNSLEANAAAHRGS